MKKTFNQLVQNRFLIGVAILFSLLFVYMIRSFVITLLIAMLSAGLLINVYRWFLKKTKQKTLSAISVVLLALLIFVVPVLLFMGLVVDQANDLTQEVFPIIEQELAETQNDDYTLPDWVPFHEEIEPHKNQIAEQLLKVSDRVGAIVLSKLAAITQETFMFFLQLFIFSYSLFFFLIYGEKYLESMRKFVPLDNEDLNELLQQGLSITRATLKGSILIGILQGSLIGLAFWVLGIRGAAFWGAVSIILSIIPSIGSGFVWMPAVIYLFATGQNVQAIILLVWGGLIVGSLDNVLRPKLIGKDAKMSDLMILLSTLGGLGFFGISGFILGPILAGLMITIWRIYGKTFIENQ